MNTWNLNPHLIPDNAVFSFGQLKVDTRYKTVFTGVHDNELLRAWVDMLRGKRGYVEQVSSELVAPINETYRLEEIMIYNEEDDREILEEHEVEYYSLGFCCLGVIACMQLYGDGWLGDNGEYPEGDCSSEYESIKYDLEKAKIGESSFLTHESLAQFELPMLYYIPHEYGEYPVDISNPLIEERIDRTYNYYQKMLADCNDGGWSFDEIGELIESHLLTED